MEDAINATELDLDQEEVNFIILYLFSWTQDIDELETSYLVNMQEKGIRWIKLLKESQSQKKLSSSEQQSLQDLKWSLVPVILNTDQ